MKTTSNEMRTLYVLSNSVWDANDWLNDTNTDPKCTDLYLFATKEEAISKAKALDFDDDIYNDGIIYTGQLSTEEILDITGFDDMAEFDEALAEPYSTTNRVKNFGEDEKGEVAVRIFEDHDDEENVECANYDFNKSLEGCILVFWSWERYIGYARKCIEVRRAYSDETEAMLTKQDKVFATQCDILLTADEVAQAEDLQQAVREAMERESWKWQNTSFVETMINEF